MYDPPIIKMDQLIDQMSDGFIKKYTDNNIIVDISTEEQQSLMKYTRKLQYFPHGNKWQTTPCVTNLFY